ncbi:hypothetical protein AALC16_24750 [Lachnospiraceae bacterium 29-91]
MEQNPYRFLLPGEELCIPAKQRARHPYPHGYLAADAGALTLIQRGLLFEKKGGRAGWI